MVKLTDSDIETAGLRNADSLQNRNLDLSIKEAGLSIELQEIK